MKKLAVIIGAGSGLGLDVAKKFGSEGFETILVARNEESTPRRIYRPRISPKST